VHLSLKSFLHVLRYAANSGQNTSGTRASHLIAASFPTWRGSELVRCAGSVHRRRARTPEPQRSAP